jgi:thymidine phosphorylase
MNTPLGVTVGNALEVRESVDCLKGGGPADLRDLVVALADHPEAAAALDDGRAYAAYEAMVRQQGGDPDAPLHGAGCREHVITAERAGVVARMDALAIGRAAFQLGAGRRRAEDPVDFGVGLEVLAKPGDAVDAGQPLLRVWHRDGYGLDSALGEVAAGVTLSDGPVVPAPLIHEEVTAS